MPNAPHQNALKMTLGQFPQAKTRGFARALKAAIPEHDDGDFDPIRIIPDAYWIDHENTTVLAIEVEVGSLLTESKMEAYCDLYWVLSDFYWDLVLKTVNRFGKQTALVDMADVALDYVVAEARAAH